MKLDPQFMEMLRAAADEHERAKARRELDPEDIIARLNDRVIGQEHLVRPIAETVSRRLAKKKSKKGTASNLFISGPSGTGKTELAKQLADAIGYDLLLVQCGVIGTDTHKVGQLTGMPKGYVGAHRGKLAEKIDESGGKLVVVFDEIEKSFGPGGGVEAPIPKMLLTLMDDGKFQNSYDMGESDFSRAVIMLTSNLKARELGEAAKKIDDPDELQKRATALLSEPGGLAPEFIQRLDLISTTRPLDTFARSRLAQVLLERIFRENEFDGRPTPELIPLLLAAADQIGATSARETARWLERAVSDDIIDAAERGVTKAHVGFDIDAGRLTITPIGRT